MSKAQSTTDSIDDLTVTVGDETTDELKTLARTITAKLETTHDSNDEVVVTNIKVDKSSHRDRDAAITLDKNTAVAKSIVENALSDTDYSLVDMLACDTGRIMLSVVRDD